MTTDVNRVPVMSSSSFPAPPPLHAPHLHGTADGEAFAVQRSTVLALVAQHQAQPGALLPLLHAVQDALGYVPPDAVPLIAQGLNLSRSEVHGVLSYYHYFRNAPAGRVVVQLCQAEACRACGSQALTAAAERILGCGLGQTRADGAVTLEPVYCLGLCAQSPSASVAGLAGVAQQRSPDFPPESPPERLYARLTPERLQTLAQSWGVAVVSAAPDALEASA
jgi:formate dehydrogenase subunit gamma